MIASWYVERVISAVARIRLLSGDQLTAVLDFGGLFQLPAALYLPFALKHSIHHRGQLSTHLRPLGSKVPVIYGRSADEG